jgi:hypothetical protein
VAGKASAELLVEDNTQKGIMHAQFIVVVNKAEFPEFVYEEIHAWPPQAWSQAFAFRRIFEKDIIRGLRD